MYEDNKRPNIKVPYSKVEKAAEVIGIIVLLIAVGMVIKYLPLLPDTIPTHFNAAGEVDGYGSKGSLLILPIVSIVLYLMLTILSRFPQIYNYPTEITEDNAQYQYENARKLMIYLKVEIIVVFTFIEGETINSALNSTTGLGLWFLPICLVVIFGTLIRFIVKSLKVNK